MVKVTRVKAPETFWRRRLAFCYTCSAQKWHAVEYTLDGDAAWWCTGCGDTLLGGYRIVADDPAVARARARNAFHAIPGWDDARRKQWRAFLVRMSEGAPDFDEPPIVPGEWIEAARPVGSAT